MKLNTLLKFVTTLTFLIFAAAQAAEPVSIYASKTKGANIAEYTLDDDLSTRWTAKGKGEFIQYKFAEPTTIKAINIAFLKGDKRAVTFQIESTDTPWSVTPNWQQQPLIISDRITDGLQTYTLTEPVTAKFFRIVGYGYEGLWGWSSDFISINEVEFVEATPAPFVTTWQTDPDVYSGYEYDTTLTIRTNPNFTYDYTIDWGDGNIEENQTTDATHTYDEHGTYTISISGEFPHLLHYSGYSQKLLTIEQWGDIKWRAMNSSFQGCVLLTINATDAPDLALVTNMAHMFDHAHKVNSPLNHWDVSTVTVMRSMFQQAHEFNQDLNTWDVSSVTDMSYMFYIAFAFNQHLSDWDVSSVTDMKYMFDSAKVFNGDIGAWGADLSSVTDMRNMLRRTYKFNQDISDWDVSSVMDMSNMFLEAGISTDNYDKLLNSWSQLDVHQGVIFDAGNSVYSSEGAAGRASLIDSKGWDITDGSNN